MTTTTFTINTSSVFNNIPTLRQLGAMAIAWHAATPNDFAECYCGGTCNWTFGLPEATTFNIPGTHTRNSLRKLLGADAMVRGVRVSEQEECCLRCGNVVQLHGTLCTTCEDEITEE